MTILRALRDRRNASADRPKPLGATPAGSAEEADLPFAGYDRLDDKRDVKSRAAVAMGRKAAMTDSTTAHLPNAMPAEITRALVSLWTEYAGKRPTNARTDVRGNVVTCELANAVGDFNQRMMAPQKGDTVRGVGKLTPAAAAYKREAVAAVVRLTRQRVASFVSSYDRCTDVATEVFTLEPSLSRGAPRAERRFRHASWPPPVRARAGT